MSVPGVLVEFVEPWSRLYSDSAVLPTIVVFLHLAALVIAGGLSIAMDRATLRAAGMDADWRGRHLADLRAAHRIVLAGLALSLVSGVLLATADLETYFGSWIYWTKMTMIALLLTNGFRMTRAEAKLRGSENEAGWTRLRFTAAASIALWLLITLAGVALVNAA